MKLKYILPIFFMALFFFKRVDAQEQNVDSLLQELKTHTQEDTVRMLLFSKIGKYYITADHAKIFPYEDSAYVLAEKLHNLYWLSNSCNGIGASFLYEGDYSMALNWFQRALNIANQIGNDRRISQAKTNISVVKRILGDFNSSMEFMQNSLTNAIKAGQKDQIAAAMKNIAGLYADQSNYPKALEYAQKALVIEEQLNDKAQLAESLDIIGIVYVYLLDSTKARYYLEKALSLDEQTGNKEDMSNVYLNLGNIASDMANDYTLALDLHLKSLHIREQSGIIENITGAYTNIAFDYKNLSDFSKAFDYADSAISTGEKTEDKISGGWQYAIMGEIYAFAPASVLTKKGIDTTDRYAKSLELLNKGLKSSTMAGILQLQRDEWKNISIVFEKQMNYASSLDAYKNYITIRDSIINDSKKKEIMRLGMQYDYDKKTDSIKLEEKITNEKMKQQQQQLTLKQEQLELSNKEKDIQKLAYLKTQADLQNEQLQKQEDDKQLTIAQKEKELQQTQVKNLSQQQTLSKLHLQQQWFISIAILLLLAAVAFGFIYNNRLKQGRLKTELAKEKAEQEKKDAEFQRSLADVSLTALRSQMNPHFIFNCLNSIKLYTTQNDTAAAVEYLSKFSKLIRLVMENSRNDRIPLSSELQALRLYIEMEAMRFKEKLQYNISVANDVETDYIEIPPLLLQPYVENAIWHGLMQKEEGGRIDVDVSMHKDHSLLEINITDNGIGRAKSAEMKSKTATKHKSYGMKVTSERIALINQIYKTGANVSIHDLAGADGKATGTRVTIQIPV